MKKPVMVLVAILVAAVGWIFFKNFRVQGLNQLKVVPVSPSSSTSTGLGGFFTDSSVGSGSTSLISSTKSIRVATFNIAGFNDVRSRTEEALDLFARITRQFDVVAVQGIAAESDNALPRFVAYLNKAGATFDFAIGPRLGPKNAQEQYAFLFNRQRVEFDRTELYTVVDRDDVMLREPLVGWFRAVGPPPEDAFTFSLINLKIEPELVLQESEVLVRLIQAVRHDGRGEDDVILAGDFRASPDQLRNLKRFATAGFAVRDIPTNTAGDAVWSNLFFVKVATTEYTGQSGVFDFLREYNLPLEAALNISATLPVWAEFSVFEGGNSGRVAVQSNTTSLE